MKRLAGALILAIALAQMASAEVILQSAGSSPRKDSATENSRVRSRQIPVQSSLATDLEFSISPFKSDPDTYAGWASSVAAGGPNFELGEEAMKTFAIWQDHPIADRDAFTLLAGRSGRASDAASTPNFAADLPLKAFETSTSLGLASQHTDGYDRAGSLRDEGDREFRGQGSDFQSFGSPYPKGLRHVRVESSISSFQWLLVAGIILGALAAWLGGFWGFFITMMVISLIGFIQWACM